MKVFRALLVAGGSAILAGNGCGDPAEPVVPIRVEVTAVSDTVEAERTLQLHAEVIGSDERPMTGQVVAWTSSARGIAEVDAGGLVTASAVDGPSVQSVVIRATVESVSGSITLRVRPIAVATVSVTPATATLGIGQVLPLSVSASDQTGRQLAGRQVTWSSSSPTTASISQSGQVTGLSAGPAVITASVEGKTATTEVAVYAPPAIQIGVGSSKAFVGDGTTVSWTASDATGCSASGAWSGALAPQGAQQASIAKGGGNIYRIQCEGPGGSSKDSAVVIGVFRDATTSHDSWVKTAPPLPTPAPACGQSGRAYADFRQNGDVLMATNSLVYSVDGTIAGAQAGTICFLRRGTGTTWTDVTAELLDDRRGCIHPRQALVADFNRDSKPDVFFACHGPEIGEHPGEASILLLSTPAGRFERRPLPIIAFTHSAAAGDVSGDGYPDLLFLNGTNSSVAGPEYVTFLINKGDGTFQRDDSRLKLPSTYGVRPNEAALIDIDEDGLLDAIVGGGDIDGDPGAIPSTIFWGSISGNFNVRPHRMLPRVPSCTQALQYLKIGGSLYVLRQCLSGGNKLQKIQIGTWTSTLIWEDSNPYSSDAFGAPHGWIDWLFVRDGAFVGDWHSSLRIPP